jgi:hypothetical protein
MSSQLTTLPLDRRDEAESDAAKSAAWLEELAREEEASNAVCEAAARERLERIGELAYAI